MIRHGRRTWLYRPAPRRPRLLYAVLVAGVILGAEELCRLLIGP